MTQGFHQTHHQAGSHDGRKDGDEYVAQRLDHPLGQGLPGGGGFDLVLGGGGHAGDGQKFIVDLVHRAGAQNELELAVGAEHALDPLHMFQGFHVDFAVVHRH